MTNRAPRLATAVATASVDHTLRGRRPALRGPGGALHLGGRRRRSRSLSRWQATRSARRGGAAGHGLGDLQRAHSPGVRTRAGSSGIHVARGRRLPIRSRPARPRTPPSRSGTAPPGCSPPTVAFRTMSCVVDRVACCAVDPEKGTLHRVRLQFAPDLAARPSRSWWTTTATRSTSPAIAVGRLPRRGGGAAACAGAACAPVLTMCGDRSACGEWTPVRRARGDGERRARPRHGTDRRRRASAAPDARSPGGRTSTAPARRAACAPARRRPRRPGPRGRGPCRARRRRRPSPSASRAPRRASRR